MLIKYRAIGIIKTTFTTIDGMPIQPKAAQGVKGTVIIKKRYIKGLKDLEGFSHIYLIFHLHKSKRFNLQVIPFLDTKPHGVFATRAPGRPNPVGISVVRLLNIRDNILEIENVDMLDGTPLLDIKPYTLKFDRFDTEKEGWLDEVPGKVNEIKSDTRFN